MMTSSSELITTPAASIMIPNTKSFNFSGLIAYVILFFLGIGSLLPFYAFITAQNYYANKFCDTIFKESFESFISIFYNVSQPIGLMYTIKYKNALSTGSQVVYPLILYTVLFALTSMFVLITVVEGNALFSITLICAFLCGLSSAVMNGGLFGLTGTLPPVTTSAIMNGQAFAGLLIAVVNLITTASSSSTISCSDDANSGTDDDSTCDSGVLDYGAFSFFLVSTFILLACILLYLVLMTLDYITYYARQRLIEQSPAMQQEEGTINRLHALMEAAANDSNFNNNNKNSIKNSNINHVNSTDSTDSSDADVKFSVSGGSLAGSTQSGHNYIETTVMNKLHNNTNTVTTVSNNTIDQPISPTHKNNNQNNSNINSNNNGNNNSHIRSSMVDEQQSARNTDFGGSVSGSVSFASQRSSHTITSVNPLYESANLLSGGIAAVYAFAAEPTLQGGDQTQGTIALSAVSWQQIKLILYFIRVPAYSVFVTFMLSLSVYPSLLVLIQSQQHCEAGASRVYTDMFIPFLFLIYSATDFIGRVLAERLKDYSPFTATNIYIPATARVAIIVLLFFTNIQNSVLPVLFPYDAVPFLLVTLLGLTNGYIANLSMMYGPTLVSAQDMALAGTIMVFCLSFGLLCGSAISFLFLYIVTGSVV